MTEALGYTPLEARVSPEVEFVPERIFIPGADFYTISGLSGSKKTTAAEIITGDPKALHDPRNTEISRALKVEGLRLVPVGQLIREEVEKLTGGPYEEHFRVKKERDLFFDQMQEDYMAEARRPRIEVHEGQPVMAMRNQLMLEGRFSGIIGARVDRKMRGTRYAPKNERILIYTTDHEEQMQLLYERVNHNPDFNLSFSDYKKLEIEREKGLRTKARELFSEEVGTQDIFDPDLMLLGREKPTQVYTITINSAGKSHHEVAYELHRKLRGKGAIVELDGGDTKQFADTPEGRSSFLLLLTLPRCEGLLEGNPCNRYGKMTVDVYINDQIYNQIPACSGDHANYIRKRHEEFGKSIKDQLSVSKNGFPPASNN